MNRFELYKLAAPYLLLLDVIDDSSNPFLTNTLCSDEMFKSYAQCAKCPFYDHSGTAVGSCLLDLRNESAKQLKDDLKIKHPELFI